MITVKDEELHPPGSSPHWQESFYFNWSNPDASEYGFTRIGFNHAERKANLVFAHVSAGKPVLLLGTQGIDFDGEPLDQSASDGLTVSGVTYRMVEPLKTWHLSLEGKNSIDLTWTAFTPVVDFHDSIPDGVERVQEHFEQAGTVTGTITVDGAERTINGMGERDKSWGVRDWNGLIGWEWIAGQFGKDLAFNATRSDVNGGMVSTGFVYDDGEAHGVTDVVVDYRWARVDQPDSAVITVTVEGGRRYTINSFTRGRLPLAKSGLFIEESPSVFTIQHNGAVREGAGIVEHTFHVGRLGTLRRLRRLLPVAQLARKMAK